MKIKVSNEDKQIIKAYLEKYVSLKEFEDYIVAVYPFLVAPEEDGSYLDIINDYYIDEEDLELYNSSKEEYIKNNFKKMLYISDKENLKYQIALNKKDTSKDNYVKNGSLVLKINRVYDFNGDASQKLIEMKEFEEYLSILETQISQALDAPVKILSYKVHIPIVNK